MFKCVSKKADILSDEMQQWRRDSTKRRERVLIKFDNFPPSVHEIFIAYQSELKQLDCFNKKHDLSEQLPGELIKQFSACIEQAGLNVHRGVYEFELFHGYDFSYPGMRCLLKAVILSIPKRDKPVNLNLSQYPFKKSNSYVLDLILASLTTTHLLNISEISLSGNVLPTQLRQLMCNVSGSNLQVLRLNQLVNINAQHMYCFADGLDEDTPFLGHIDLKDWRNAEQQNETEFMVSFYYFLDKLALYCSGLRRLNLACNEPIRSCEREMAFVLGMFRKKAPDCEVILPESNELNEGKREKPNDQSVVSQNSPAFFSRSLRQGKGGFMLQVPSTLKKPATCYNRLSQPWIEQQKRCDEQRLVTERWLSKRRMAPITRSTSNVAACVEVMRCDDSFVDDKDTQTSLNI